MSIQNAASRKEHLAWSVTRILPSWVLMWDKSAMDLEHASFTSGFPLHYWHPWTARSDTSFRRRVIDRRSLEKDGFVHNGRSIIQIHPHFIMNSCCAPSKYEWVIMLGISFGVPTVVDGNWDNNEPSLPPRLELAEAELQRDQEVLHLQDLILRFVGSSAIDHNMSYRWKIGDGLWLYLIWLDSSKDGFYPQ